MNKVNTTLRALSGSDIRRYAEEGRDFRAASMTGEAKRKGSSSWESGRLTGGSLERFTRDGPDITYVVFGYATPIAWQTRGRFWHVVTESFSPTTRKHQACLRGLA